MEQYIFTKDYVDELQSNVKKGDISAYHVDHFDYNADASFSTGINRPDDLAAKMLEFADPSHDYDAAITLFEAFPDLTREQACYYPFWTYLTHVDLYEYMIKRFCPGNTPSLEDLNNHWWYAKLVRHGLANLWWSVKQTVDEDANNNLDKYHYTRYFFKHLDFRQRRLGSSTLFRHKEAVFGILKYLEENVTDYFEGRSNFIMMYFNRQATIKELSVYDRDDFYKELQGIENQINKVRVRTQAADVVKDTI